MKLKKHRQERNIKSLNQKMQSSSFFYLTGFQPVHQFFNFWQFEPAAPNFLVNHLFVLNRSNLALILDFSGIKIPKKLSRKGYITSRLQEKYWFSALNVKSGERCHWNSLHGVAVKSRFQLSPFYFFSFLFVTFFK